MEASSKTARQLFSDIKANPTRKRFGFGKMPALVDTYVEPEDVDPFTEFA